MTTRLRLVFALALSWAAFAQSDITCTAGTPIAQQSRTKMKHRSGPATGTPTPTTVLEMLTLCSGGSGRRFLSLFMSTVEMARLIRTKNLSAREALAAHLKQIERVNPKVNAIAGTSGCLSP
jgi:hypothetical protein